MSQPTPSVQAPRPKADSNPETNDLIEKEKPEHGFFQGNVTLKGAGIADSLNEAIGDFGRIGEPDFSVTEAVTDGAVLALDVLGIVMNPFGELGKAAAGWLIEHVDFLREGIEVVTGDPDAVKALKGTWTNIANELNSAASDYERELTSVQSWMAKTPSGQIYHQTATAYVSALRASSEKAASAAKVVEYSGIAVASVRGLIFDLIAELVGKWIGKLIAAGLTALFTLGASAAAFITSAIADACALARKIFGKLRKLTEAIEQLGVFIRKFSNSAAGAAASTKATRAAVDSGIGAVNNVGKRATDALGTVGKVAGSKGTVAAKEAVKEGTNAEHPQ
ncbi:hypothetical protein M8C13_11640 [Crossiella sp. SN42]|uniref:PPE domain-containing protein n=1 Tax=Crossiella sp. SN42 TaxID=2944808 RepID=UPI00207C1481|nr:hypothetical protein [Crossiella sp. SN42]MCO1576400.1 hypothetical protein [Crossiella sp. SN42]